MNQLLSISNARKYLIAVYILTFSFVIKFHGQDDSTKSACLPLILSDSFPYGRLNTPFRFYINPEDKYLELLEATIPELDIDILLRKPKTLTWNCIGDETEFQKSSVYWFRLRLFNPFEIEKESWIWMTNRGWKNMRAYVPDHYGAYHQQRIDPHAPLQDKALPFWMPLFKANVSSRDTITVFLKLQAIQPDILLGRVENPVVRQVSPRSFSQVLPFRSYYTGIMHGFLLIQFLFFAIIYLITRDKSILYLAVFLAGYAMYDLHESLFKEEFNAFYWGYEAYWAIFLRFPATLIFGYGLIKFVETYIELPTIFPATKRWINIYIGTFAIVSLFSYIDENTIYPIEGVFVFQFHRILAFLFFIFIIVIPGIAIYHRKPYALFLLIGLAPIGVAGIVGIFMITGIIPLFMPYRDIFRVGTALSMITLSIGAGYRINTFRHQEIELGKTKELDILKTRFYTNITHEFRTPLTVIQGVSDQIEGHREEKELIQRNSHQLLDLINRMLDLSKLEAGKLPLNLVYDDILRFLRYITESFHSLALNQKININFYSDVDTIKMDYDPEKILQILSNLISNAIKFTPEYGKVTIIAREKHIDAQPMLMFQVKDTGIGISPDQLPHLFDRFYQADASPTRRAEGTGIGLALTKELIELMEGHIEVESKEGIGATFSVWLPIRKTIDTGDQKVAPYIIKHLPKEGEILEESIEQLTAANIDQEQPTILIVEDNLDVMQYLASCLNNGYQLLFARNGREGIAQALEHIPDIIISDVMMPELDGFELCKILKQEERSSHIPIILLTAKADMKSKLEGLEYGADAYLTKPFHKSELDIRLRKLIELRRKLQRKYNQANFESEPATEKEDAFVLKVRELVLTHLDDSQFSIEALSDALHMSRIHLHRKLKALTGKPTSHFIRQIRLHEGYRLLKVGELNVSEVAYTVGFSDPAYFSKLFSQEFGHPPSMVPGS